MRAIVIPLVAAALCGCSGARHTVASTTDSVASQSLASHDTLALRYHLRVDSPLVTVDYIDTPRRRVTYSARRVAVVGDASGSASTAVKTATSAHSDNEESRQPSSGIKTWMLVLSAIGAAAIGLWIGRHTS